MPRRLSKWQWVDNFAEGSYSRLIEALRSRAARLGILRMAILSELELGLQERNNIKLLSNAIDEADTLLRVGKLPIELEMSLIHAYETFENLCITQGQLTLRMRARELMERKKSLDQLLQEKQNGRLYLYDGISIDELIKAANEAFIEFSADTLSDFQERILKIPSEYSSATTSILKDALKLPFHPAHYVILAKKLVEIKKAPSQKND